MSHLTPANVAVLQQLNRDALPDLCTVEQATKVPTPTGGHTEGWAPIDVAHTDMAARVSMRGAPRETAGPSPREQADYTVALDGRLPAAHDVGTQHRLQVRSGEGVTPAWALTLWVLAIDGPQSLNPFPMVWCTTTPQVGQ